MRYMPQGRTCNRGLQSTRLSGKWAVGYPEQPRIARPIGCESKGELTKENNSTENNRRANNDHIGIVGNDSKESEDSLGHYEVYVVCPQLKEGLGIALIDSGSQISLVKESSLIKYSKEKDENHKVYGITGKHIEIKGQVKLKIENTLEASEQKCYVVDNLPRNLDIILGQDWLANEGYGFQKKTSVIIPPCSEVVKCKTSEKGIRFIEHQITQPGLMCASSLVSCENFEFPCLMINLTDKPKCMTSDPKLEKPPTMMSR